MSKAHRIIIKPIVTEKSMGESERVHAWSFQVPVDANKIEIGKAVEELFNVRVDSVRTVLMKGKRKRNRFRMGKRPNWKKAIVKLHPDDRIEIL
jgi:large subunit ribosomal protein L23